MDFTPNNATMSTDIKTNYRNDDYLAITRTSKITGFEFVCIYSTQVTTIAESIISICRTFFITTVLGLSAFYFMRDANRLVLYPIERICEKLKFIAKNPQAAVNGEYESEAVQLLEMVHNNGMTDK